MECANPISVSIPFKGRTNPAIRPVVNVRCGQCLACRVNKRDALAGRMLLEQMSAACAQFWTLTYSEEAVTSDRALLVRQARNFCSALRMHEVRSGNPLPIRFFGVCEFAPLTQRPHWHLAVYNHLNSIKYSEPYRKGLPRPLIHIGQWPHGHIDVGQMNGASARYIAKYVTKFNLGPTDPEEDVRRPIAIYPQKPPLGYAGLQLYMEALSQVPAARSWIQKPAVIIGQRTWPLNTIMLHQWYYLANFYGIKHIPRLPTWQETEKEKELLKSLEGPAVEIQRIQKYNDMVAGYYRGEKTMKLKLLDQFRLANQYARHRKASDD